MPNQNDQKKQIDYREPLVNMPDTPEFDVEAPVKEPNPKPKTVQMRQPNTAEPLHMSAKVSLLYAKGFNPSQIASKINFKLNVEEIKKILNL